MKEFRRQFYSDDEQLHITTTKLGTGAFTSYEKAAKEKNPGAEIHSWVQFGESWIKVDALLRPVGPQIFL